MWEKKKNLSWTTTFAVVLWRCFIKQPPVQDDHFWVVPRVIVLYRFDFNSKTKLWQWNFDCSLNIAKEIWFPKYWERRHNDVILNFPFLHDFEVPKGWVFTSSCSSLTEGLGFIASCSSNSSNIYLLELNNRNTRKRCEVCYKFTIKRRERRHGILVSLSLTFAHISHLFSSVFNLFSIHLKRIF